MAVQFGKGAGAPPVSREQRGCVREEWKRMPKSPFNDSGAVLMLCPGPWEPILLINKILICTMCLQHLSRCGEKVYVFRKDIDLSSRTHEHYFSLDWINDMNYYPQSIKAFTAELLCPFPNLMNYLTFLRNALAFLRIASLKITEKYLCIVVTSCSLSCCLRSHTLTRELSMVLREGSLRNTTMGVFTKLYIDMQNTARHHGIQDLKWSCSIHHTSTRMLGNSPPNKRLCISGGWLEKQQQAPPPSRVRKHDWLHMPAFSTIITAGIYLAGPHLLLLSSYAASYHLDRKCVISLSRGSLWGEALLYYEVRHSPSSGLLQDLTHAPDTHAEKDTGIGVMWDYELGGLQK